jgi:glycosyltransferase involved in cell wall biosynthesis
VQPDAAPWVERLQRPGPGEGAVALAWWLLRRPLRTLSVAGTVVAAHARRPGILVRALATIPLAAAHARRFRRARVDHVHAHFANYPTLAAWVAHRLAGVPYSFTPHAHDLFVHQAMLARKAADAAFVVAISDYNRRFLLEQAGPEISVPIVRYGIDPARFPFQVRPANGTAPPRIACVGRLLAYKGHAVLLRALAGADVPPPLAGAQLELVGDGPLRAELERDVAALGLRDRVRFHGAVPEPVVADVLARADVFALPSVISPDGDREGIPNALIEAMAAGLPAVSTYHSGVPELIEDGRTGYLAQPGDVDDLRAALVRALTEPDPAPRAEAARAVVEAEFSQHRSARRLVELFGAVSAGGGSSGRSRG